MTTLRHAVLRTCSKLDGGAVNTSVVFGRPSKKEPHVRAKILGCKKDVINSQSELGKWLEDGTLQVHNELFISKSIEQAELSVNNHASNSLRDLKKVLVEFGSPNIAKPFHPGNFRSVVIGHFVSNLLASRGVDVIKMNYFGDWGKQFGILLKTLEDVNGGTLPNCDRLPSQREFLALYAAGCQRCNDDEKFEAACSEICRRLDGADASCLRLWKSIRKSSISHAISLYRQFGIEFDEIAGESDYRDAGNTILKKLRCNFEMETVRGAERILVKGEKQDAWVTVRKSDGSYLYLTRDIAAALDRIENFRPLDHMFYVVDRSQFQHFNNLFSIIKKISGDQIPTMTHLSFGRVLGMSSRNNQALDLETLLLESINLAREKLAESPFTKSQESDFDEVSKIVGISSLIVNEFNYKRTSDYKFNWEKLISFSGKSATYMHFIHARICSIFRELDIDLTSDEVRFAAEFLNDEKQPVLSGMLDVCANISNFGHIIDESQKNLDGYIVVDYCFKLCRSLSTLYNLAPCVDEDNERLQRNRLAVFRAGILVLRRALGLVGVKPLERL